MVWVKWILIVVGILAIDRLLLAAEEGGWIYYRRRKPHLILCMAAALFQMQSILQPETQHIVEQKQEMREDEDEDGKKIANVIAGSGTS
jgi:hypothetical protein